jgi:pyroglutamyl-peptidase
MTAARPTLLITGFGPFPGVPANATTELVPALTEEARKRWPSHRFEGAVLATEWRAAPQTVSALMADLKPSTTLHFGVSSKATGFTIEMRGHNLARRLPDAAGQLPEGAALVPESPDLLPASIPVSLIVERLRQRDLSVCVSRDAGGYLCNAVLYSALDAGRRLDRTVRSGFVHLPANLARRPLPGYGPPSGLTWTQAMEGSLEVISVLIGRPLRR